MAKKSQEPAPKQSKETKPKADKPTQSPSKGKGDGSSWVSFESIRGDGDEEDEQGARAY